MAVTAPRTPRPDTRALASHGGSPRRHDGFRIQAAGLTSRTTGGATTLDRASLIIEPGELVAVIGGSGAGKTTLLDALAGVRPAESGTVTYDGIDQTTRARQLRNSVGYVPQDDIIHLELPLERTLRYAAALRWPAGSARRDLDAAVTSVLEELDLTDRAHVPVAALSGGQRKRASIAVELLTSPRACFLDEPTSGLDPANSTSLLRLLRRLADAGSTIVFTTHSVQDLSSCDRIVVLAAGGRVVFSGPLPAALAHFDVDRPEEIYDRLNHGDHSSPPSDVLRAAAIGPDGRELAESSVRAAVRTARRPSAVRQWAVLSRRSTETLVRNRLTLAILVGSPMLVIAMFTVLFQPGAFGPGPADDTATVMIAYWIAFAGFFFGLTYGLLQVCSEVPILRRERHAGLGLGAYLLAKVTVLTPFLLVVNTTMLVVLRATDRLPDLPGRTYAAIAVTLALDALAALALGLLASAAVSTTAQAALALPMICFPAVLFAGAVVPVDVMAPAGRVMAAVVPDRWAFDAVAADLGLRESATGPWPILTLTTLVLLVAARLVIGVRATPAQR